MRSLWNLIALAVCLIGLSAPHYAQEPDALLSKAASALGSSGVKTVRFVVAGSGYEVGPAADRSTWRHIRIDRELRELDIEHLTLRKGDRVIDTNSPWQDQVEIWSMPEAFLKAAKPANIVGEWKAGTGVVLARHIQCR